MNQIPNRIYSYSAPTRLGVWPVTVAEMGDHLRIDSDVLATEADYILLLIKSATLTAEHWTKRTFVVSQYTAWLDSFCSLYYFGNPSVFTVRRSPLISMDSIEYYKSGEAFLTAIDSAEYRVTESPDFATVYPVDSWPTDVDDRYQAIKFTFTAGYPDNPVPDPEPDESTVPFDIKDAIKQHVASMWAKRGDCSQDVPGSQVDSIASGSLPQFSKMVYMQNSILNLYEGQ